MDIFLLILFAILSCGVGMLFGGLAVLFRHDDILEKIKGIPGRKFNRELLIDTVNANKNGMFICTSDGLIVFSNKAMAELLGYTIEELNTKTFIEITPDEYIPQDEYFLKKSQNEGLETFEIRKKYLHKNGKHIPINLQVSSLRNSKGDITFYIVNAQIDVISKTNIIVNHKYFEAAFNYSKIGMALLTRDGSFIRVNQEFARMLGYTTDELIRKTFQEITHSDDLPVDISYYEKMLNREIDTYNMAKKYIKKDGNAITAMLSVSAVYDENNEVTTFVSQIQAMGDVNG